MGAAETARPAAPPTGKPILLDTYCKAGGAARGYQMAGFYVVGVDLEPQPRYAGDEFRQGDAIEFIRRHGRAFDAIHASPPCQLYCDLAHLTRPGCPDLIEPTRVALRAVGRPYVIENVVRAPLLSPLKLCGAMFGLGVYRHRKFESSVFLLSPPHPRHRERCRKAGRWEPTDRFVSVVGKGRSKAMMRYSAIAMGIDWMLFNELTQAIPPAYTSFVGAQLLRALGVAS